MAKRKKTIKHEQLSVVKALSELEKLKTTQVVSTDDYSDITKIYTEEAVEKKVAIQEPTSENLTDGTETGYGFNIKDEKMSIIETKIENENLKMESKIKNDINSVKNKSITFSINISLAISTIISAILISVVIYMNNNLKEEIHNIKQMIKINIQKLTNDVNHIDNEILILKTQLENHKDTSMLKRKDGKEKEF